MSSKGLKVTRRLFGFAEHVAPALAGRLAFSMFSRTPDLRKQSEGERRAVARAASFMREARTEVLAAGKGRVAVHEFAPRPGRGDAGTVLVLHGWRSRTEYMSALIGGFLEAGFRVVSPDLPGHGRSSGRHLTMVSGIEAVRAVADRFGPFAAVVGHSFGGAIAANAVAGTVRRIVAVEAGRLVLIASPSAMTPIFSGFGRHVGLGPRTQAAFESGVLRISGRPVEDYDGKSQLVAAGVPTLVIHAPDDREVPFEQAESYASAGAHVRLQPAPGLGHRRILADPGVVRSAVAFVAKQQVV